VSTRTVAKNLNDLRAVAYATSRDLLVIAEHSGRILALDLLRMHNGLYEKRPLGDGYRDVIDIAVDDGNSALIVADADGLWRVDLLDADRENATAFANLPQECRAIGCIALPGGGTGLLVLDGKPSPHLDLYNLDGIPGSTRTTKLSGLDGAFNIAPGDDDRTVYILANEAVGVKLRVGDISTASTSSGPSPLPFGGPVAFVKSGWAAVASPQGSLALAKDIKLVRKLELTDVALDPVVDLVLDKNQHVFLASQSSIAEVNLPLGVTGDVYVQFDPQPIFIGSYTPAHFDFTASGVSFDEVEVSVDNADLGAISPSLDDTFDPLHPHLQLIGGWKPGTGTLQVAKRATGEIVGSAAFSVEERWEDSNLGPSFCATGILQPPISHAAWGGGEPGPQNVSVYPAPAQWRVAIVLIDTTTNTYPTVAADLSAIQTNWANHFINGVNVGGVTHSVAAYFNELSYGKMTMSLVGGAVTAPIHMTGTWEDNFDLETQPDPANPAVQVPRRWNPKPGTWQTLVTTLEQANAVSSVVNLAATDAVVFVVRTANIPFAANPPTGTSIGRFVWPQQFTEDVTLSSGPRHLPMLVMPENWTALDGRQIYETLAHELGHSLRLPDLYLYSHMNQGNAQRQIDRWDLMDSDGGLPQMSLASRMLLGWVPKNEVKSFNFAANGGGAVAETVTVQALQKTAIPANALRGVEVRIANGRNYYFEYRERQGASIGDANLPMAQVMVGTDVVSPEGGTNYDSRPYLLRLFDDPDGVNDTDGILTEGAFLSANENYKEQDFTEGAPKDFVATVTRVGPGDADLQIRYNSEAKPEVSIRTWPNGDKQWQSPDIEIRNAKNATDSRWSNVPWGGNPNDIIVKVKNHGGLSAKDVRAHVSIKDLTLNSKDQPPVQLQPLGWTSKSDIAPGAVAELKLAWVAPTTGHHCIQVDIPLYEDPANPAIHESSDRDNVAQSNYDKFWSETASPATRKRFTVTLANPTKTKRVIYAQVSQTSPFYRTYLQHKWLRLDPLESRTIEVMTESLDGDPVWADFVNDNRETLYETPNNLDISAWVEGVCTATCIGGASVQVATGRQTRIDEIEFFQEPGVRGHVSYVDNHSDVTSGSALVTLRRPDDDAASQLVYSGPVSDGWFTIYAPGLEPGMIARAYFLGTWDAAPSETNPITVEPF
jgi:M6 family metalloprotease-like protein